MIMLIINIVKWFVKFVIRKEFIKIKIFINIWCFKLFFNKIIIGFIKGWVIKIIILLIVYNILYWDIEILIDCVNEVIVVFYWIYVI